MPIQEELYGDFEDSLKQKNIPYHYFTHVIGDNGGICIEVATKKELFKRELSTNILEQIIEEYLKNGGDIKNIRLTDGKNVIAHDNELSRKYYEGSNDVIYKKEITDVVDGMTKLTLTGTKKQIKKIKQFIQQKIPNIKIHEGITKYPDNNTDNYRIDITGNYDKGTAAEELIDLLEIDRCIYLGNDLNDVSMFANGIRNNDFIVIANNSREEVRRDVINELAESVERFSIKLKDANILLLHTNNVNAILEEIEKALEDEKKSFRNKVPKNIKPTHKNKTVKKIVRHNWQRYK